MSTIVLVRGATSDSGRPFATAAQSRDEELMNSITHGLGLVLSIAGVIGPRHAGREYRDDEIHGRLRRLRCIARHALRRLDPVP